MKKSMVMLAGLVAAVVLAAGCGSSTGSSGGAAGGGGDTTVQTEHSSALNANVLVNGNQMTLYTLSAEQKGRFICTNLDDPGKQHPMRVALDSADGRQQHDPLGARVAGHSEPS